MANVSKAEIVDQLADQIGLTKKEVAEVVEGFLAQVITALEEGRQVQIRGFGTFKVQRRAARVGRNPRAGTTVAIPARPVPSFKPSKQLREAIDKSAL